MLCGVCCLLLVGASWLTVDCCCVFVACLIVCRLSVVVRCWILLLVVVCQLLVVDVWFLVDCCCVLFDVMWCLFVDMCKSFSRRCVLLLCIV